MAGAGRTTDLSGLSFVNPQRAPDGSGWTYRPVPATDPRPLPVGEHCLPWDIDIVGADRTWSLAEFHIATASASLLVLVDGELVHEWYAAGLGRGDLFLGASATKSLLAHLVGAAVRSGALGLDDLVAEHVPELAGCGYARVPVRALITMTSGVDWVEDHRDPAGPATALVSAFGRARVGGAGSSRTLLARVASRCPPGTRFAYCTADSQVLDWVRERATGVPFPAALRQLWRDLGGTADAAVAVDAEGVALAGGGVAAAARDWARIGLLQIDGRVPGGRRLLDRGWVEHASRPPLPSLRPGRLPGPLSEHVGFGYHWWPLDDAGNRVSADGSRGQFVYVDRPRRVVVVKTSAWAYADPAHDRQCRDLSYRALPAIADAARRPTRKGSHSEPQGHHHLCTDRCGGHRRQVRARAGHPAADRRVRNRGGPGRRGRRARACAGPAQRRRLP
jgi:CubicO group peptidase (beta-lactamase class C family)